MSDPLPDFDALWNYDDPAATERKFLAILDSLTLPRDVAYALQLLTQIARSQGLQGRLDDAHRTLDTVEPRIRIHPLVTIRYLLERGRVHNTSGSPEPSRDFFLKAYEQSLAAGDDDYAADAAHMLSIVCPPETRVEWGLKALDIAEKSSNPRAQKWAGMLYNNLGWTYQDAGSYAKALVMFQKALTWFEAHRQRHEMLRARVNVVGALRSLGRFEEMSMVQMRLLLQDSMAREWHETENKPDHLLMFEKYATQYWQYLNYKVVRGGS